jgi:hypothetical protein
MNRIVKYCEIALHSHRITMEHDQPLPPLDVTRAGDVTSSPKADLPYILGFASILESHLGNVIKISKILFHVAEEQFQMRSTQERWTTPRCYIISCPNQMSIGQVLEHTGARTVVLFWRPNDSFGKSLDIAYTKILREWWSENNWHLRNWGKC